MNLIKLMNLINHELVKKPLHLEKNILEALRNNKISLNQIKVTENGNLLVYPSSNEDKKSIIDNKLLFPECQFCDLDSSKKK
jgi:hypothetical protein